MNTRDPKSIENEIIALKASLYDSTTRLPAYQATFDKLKQMTQDRFLGVVLLQLSDLERVEAVFGFERYEEILKCSAREIETVNRTRFGGSLLPTMRSVFDDEFCVFVPHDLLAVAPVPSLQEVAADLYACLDSELSRKGLKGLTLNMGYAVLQYNPFLRFERLVHRVVDEAASGAQRQDETERVLRELEIRQILTERGLSTVFHPIVDLRDYVAVGYEALTRGPAGTIYESPESLFAFARESRLTWDLDRQCKLTAIASATGRPADSRLFINTLPSTLDDPEFMDGTAPELMARHGISPADVVWELTERHPIEDYDHFEATMKTHTKLGYRVAIDDVGTGYSSIQTITHVRPLYLKVDQSLVRDVEENLLKQELIASLLVLAQKVSAQVIAEGIQTPRELGMLKELGVPLGQGYLFGMPSAHFESRVSPRTA